MLFEEMRYNLGVGFGGELVALFDELPLQSEIILDDRVMCNNDAPSAIAMWLVILFRWTALGGAARMLDPELPPCGLRPAQRAAVLQFAGSHADPGALCFCK